MDLIVVGVDGSPGARSALEFAAHEAASHKATLRLVTVWEVPPAVLSTGGVAADFYDNFQDEARTILRDAEALVHELEPSVTVEQRLVEGHAGNALVDESAGVDLMVIGRRGHSALTELLLGSTSHQLADHAKCAVAIVPPRERG